MDGISFGVEEGTITGLLGPNGAGKTTTIQMLLDTLTPTSGEVKIFGRSYKNSREFILSHLNFSSPYVSMPGQLRVWENLYTFARLYNVRDIKKKVDKLMAIFDAESLLPKLTSDLSTGQMTRISLVKSLINDPRLLLLDEPTSSLDPDMADRIRKALLKIKKERGLTVLYTSHNMAEVEEMCDRVIFLQAGKIKDEGTPEELVKKYGREDLNDLFLAIARNEK